MEGIFSRLGEPLSISDYEQELFELCKDKAQEFAFLGYEHVSAEDIYKCAKVLIRKNERLHEMVAAILSLQVSQFMNFETMNAFKGSLTE
jgi:hypothetical protein